MYFVKSTWRGEKSLVFTFWVMNIVGVTALSLIMTYLGAVASTQCENVVFLLFWVIFLIGPHRSSPNPYK
jgi:hypothetical protein